MPAASPPYARSGTWRSKAPRRKHRLHRPARDMQAAPFRLGVVEGYFGRQWSWEARREYAPFLAAHGCNSYVYAPKNDAWLRKQWEVPFPLAHLDALRDLRQHYQQHDIEFGIGLSP